MFESNLRTKTTQHTSALGFFKFNLKSKMRHHERVVSLSKGSTSKPLQSKNRGSLQST